MGFEINPYDRCVANKMVNGKQCTIVWYVDDNKLSHVDEEVVTDILQKVKSHFGDIVITRGKEHSFLGMDITFTGDGTLEISTKDYVKEAVKQFSEDVSKVVSMPASHGLFTIDAESPLLSTEKSDLYHSIVAKLLWVMKRGRPDIETTIAFLCTRV